MKNNKYLLICILGCALIAFTANVQANYKLGRDYGSLSKPLPIKQDGVVDVIEIFWYGCGHCFNLAPVVSNWAKQKDSSVNYQKMPVTWGPVHQLHAASGKPSSWVTDRKARRANPLLNSPSLWLTALQTMGFQSSSPSSPVVLVT